MLSSHYYGAGVSVPSHHGGMNTLAKRIRQARQTAKLSQAALGNAFGISREAVALWESGKNAPTSDKLGEIANRTGVRAEWLMTGRGQMTARARQTAVIGYVGAGAEVHPFDDHAQGGGLEMVDPPIGYPDAAAARIRGDSMFPLRDGWLIFWTKRQDGVPDDCIGKLCIAQVANGPLLLKEVRNGKRRGRFNLESWNAPPREDVPLEWASRVVDIRPA